MAARDTDAYRGLIYDQQRALPTAEVIERDDGGFGVSTGAPAYFAPFAARPAHQRRAMRAVRGRGLDVGAGLRRLAALTSPHARIVAETRNPYRGRTADHRHYHERNRRRGRPAGQIRMRVRYGRACTAGFDSLFVSPPELRAIAAGTGWRLARTSRSGGPMYVAVLEKRRG